MNVCRQQRMKFLFKRCKSSAQPRSGGLNEAGPTYNTEARN
uniref:Uncharacterized protein n=1 Tax=Anguilla anguilla TaxID=7936 RepID=A0A0E9XZ99_ANGAN